MGSHKNTRKSNLVTGGVTTQPEMHTKDRSHDRDQDKDRGYFPHVFTQIPLSTLSSSRSPTQKYDEIEASNISTVREIMRIRPNMQ